MTMMMTGVEVIVIRKVVNEMILTEEQKQLAYAALMAYGNKLYDMATTIPNEHQIVNELSEKSKSAFALAKDIISDDGTGIKRATAINTSGGIYLYYAELINGKWLMGNDGWLIIVNENPLKDKQTFEASCYHDWQMEHLVNDVSDVEMDWWMKSIFETIKAGRTIEEYDNFLLAF